MLSGTVVKVRNRTMYDAEKVAEAMGTSTDYLTVTPPATKTKSHV